MIEQPQKRMARACDNLDRITDGLRSLESLANTVLRDLEAAGLGLALPQVMRHADELRVLQHEFDRLTRLARLTVSRD